MRDEPGLGKWGTTRIAREIASSRGSPLSPFSAENILSLSLAEEEEDDDEYRRRRRALKGGKTGSFNGSAYWFCFWFIYLFSLLKTAIYIHTTHSLLILQLGWRGRWRGGRRLNQIFFWVHCQRKILFVYPCWPKQSTREGGQDGHFHSPPTRCFPVPARVSGHGVELHSPPNPFSVLHSLYFFSFVFPHLEKPYFLFLSNKT